MILPAGVSTTTGIEWFKKQDARAAVMLAVRRTLSRKGVHQELQEILNEIMEQAEARYKEWYREVA